MAKKDSVIFYQSQIKICKKHMDPEQFGRLMYALFEFDEGNDPEVDDDIVMAFEFMTLQAKIDREKYEEKCRKNRENGMKGGRPKKGAEKPKKANGFFENPNENENENENENDKRMMNENEKTHTSFFHGSFNNVELTDAELSVLRNKYENASALIDKVSSWLRNAKNTVPDHYELCEKFAANENWPRRKQIPPPEPIVIEDPPTEEEQERLVASMRATLNGAFG